MTIKKLKTSLGVFVILFLVSCSKNDEMMIPSYLKIDSVSVAPDVLQGTASHNITDVWVYSESGLIGAFELPAQIPILESGNTKLNIYAGIKLNGISAARVNYPFYNPVEINVDLKRDSTFELKGLKVGYSDNCKFAWIEDFENENFTFRTTSNGKVPLQRITSSDEIFTLKGESNKSSAKAVLTNDSMFFEYASYESFKLPADGTRPTFLELNYKNSAEFIIGLFVNGSVIEQRPVLVVNPSDKWNKIYVNLTNAVNENNDANNFRIYIKMVKPSDEESAYLYLDNLKLIYTK